MTLPVSGAISFNAINVELGVAGTTTANINQASYRTLAGVPGSGTTIALSNFYGKSNRGTASFTYSSSTANASLNITSLSGYLAGNTDVTITINAGVYLYATSTANAGLTLTGGSGTDTLTIINNGFIMGQGGNGGGYIAPSGPFVPATIGGTALSLGYSATINNTNASAYIGGGGGGGGYGNAVTAGGGGAGGGVGGSASSVIGGGVIVAGGTGGGIGSSGGNGNTNSSGSTGGGGGRIFPGTGGAGGVTPATKGATRPGFGGGSGGGGSAYTAGTVITAGSGGSGNSAGTNGNSTAGLGPASGGGGGGWGASGGSGSTLNNPNAGAAGGKAVALNGYSVTWVSGNTTRVYGAVS